MDAGTELTSERTSLGLWRTFTVGASLALGATFLATLVIAAGSPDLALDFREAYLPAAEAFLDAGSPYVVNDSSPDGISGAYLYPPQLALALVPFTPLSTDVAAFVAFLVALAALMGTLALLDVRDVRCYAILLAWAPAWQAFQMANVSALLVLALAVVWRYRNRAARSGATLGLAVSLKLFLWPMLVWALATRRSRMAGYAVATGLLATFGSWAVIGFDGLTTYPDLLRAIPDQASYSIVAVAENLGYAPIVGFVLMFGIGSTLLAAVLRFARSGDEFRAFTLALAAALALTPILWWHYLSLLIIPLAIARPRFSPSWLLPIVIWMSRVGIGDGVESAIPLLVAALLLTAILVRPVQDSSERSEPYASRALRRADHGTSTVTAVRST